MGIQWTAILAILNAALTVLNTLMHLGSGAEYNTPFVIKFKGVTFDCVFSAQRRLFSNIPIDSDPG